MAAKDPFYLVKDDVQSTVSTLESSFSRWQTMPESNPQRSRLRQEVETNCESASLSLHEIERLAVAPAEKDPSKFGLDPSEVTSRRAWLNETKGKVDRINGFLQRAAQEAADKAAARAGKMKGLGADDKLNNAVVQENDKYINGLQNRQQQIIKQQDKELEDITHHVVRIGEMGKTIGRELEEQTEMINELDTETDTVKSRLEAASRKVTQVINKAGAKGQMYTIIALIVILLVLLLLVFI